MAEKLINLEMACGMLNRFFHNAPTYAEQNAILEVKQALLEMATMEVVRCKDCKHHNRPSCPMKLSLNWTRDNDFCSYGEGRGGDG